MQLPSALRALLEQRLAGYLGRDLAAAAARLAERYQAPAARAVRLSDAEREAYLAVRLPATFAAAHAALASLRRAWGGNPPAAVLDLGAGPGTATLAALEVWPGVSSVTLLEQDAAWVDVGRRLLRGMHPNLPQQWRQGDLARTPFSRADLVVAAYSLTEMDLDCALPVLRRAWEAAAGAILCLEPGTPEGFARVRRYRQELLAAGASIAAPCPHQSECPLPPGDWCHFAQRVERSALHRYLKSARLGYEDEKFAYVAAVREPVPPPGARVLRRPAVQPGAVTLRVCSRQGLATLRVTHRERERFKQARKVRWGEIWREPDSPLLEDEVPDPGVPPLAGGTLDE